VRVFGHRGSPGFPRFGENTRTSFRKALAGGAEGFELDVRRCRDGTLVVIHDSTIERTTNGAGLVRNLTYEELSRFDAGFGDTIPRLIDILDEFRRSCFIHIELKENGLAEDVLSIVQKLDRADDVAVSAFDTDDSEEDASASWADLALVSSRIATALLVTKRKLQALGTEGLIDAVRQNRARAIHAARDCASAALIGHAASGDVPVRVWTVNNPPEAIEWRDKGVESIFSDYPEECLKAIKR
jgi:glycerophosphoryl diester phosphodiesterase